MENSEKGSPARIREKLYQGTSLYSAAGDVKAIREKGVIDKPMSLTLAGLKREAYPLATVILGRVYEHAKSRFYDTQGYPIPVFHSDETHPSLDARGVTLDSLAAQDIFAALDGIRNSFARHLNRSIQDWMEPLREREVGAELSAEQKLFDRYETVIGNFDFQRGDLQRFSAFRFLASGGGTASSTSWDIIRAIPICYHEQYSQCVSRDQFMQLVRGAEQLAMELSAMHIDSFHSLGEFVAPVRGAGEQIKLEFPPALFRIEEGGGGLRLVFDEATVALWASRSVQTLLTERIRCPAREVAVTDQSGKTINFVAASYRFNAALAERVLSPNLEQYTKGVFDLSKE